MLKELASLSLTEDDRPQSLKDMVRRPQGFRYYNFLSLLARAMRPNLIVELGTNRGVSALHFRHGCHKARIISVDIRHLPEVRNELMFKGVECLTGRSVDVADQVKGPIDILFIDAEHTEEAVMQEVEAYVFKVRSGGVVLFDDVHLDESMECVWRRLQLVFPCVDLTELHPTAGFGGFVVK